MPTYRDTSETSRLAEGRRRLALLLRLEGREPWETAAAIARSAGMSRQNLYQLRETAAVGLMPGQPGPEAGWRDAERLREENDRLAGRVAELEGQLVEAQALLSASVEVTDRRKRALELVCFTQNVSLRGTQEVLDVAYGEDHRPDLAGLQTRMSLHGQTAAGLLVEGRTQVREEIRCVAADDLYFHRVDVKVVVEPRTMALLNVGRWDGSAGLDWVVWLEEYSNLVLLASDLGKDLVGAASLMGLVQVADCFHEMRWFEQKVLGPLLKNEEAKWARWWEALDAATRPTGPGRRLSPTKVEKARIAADAAQEEYLTALWAKDRVREIYDPINKRTGRLWSEEEAESVVDEILGRLKSIKHKPGARAIRHLRMNRKRYCGWLAMFDAIDVPLCNGSAWNPRAVLNGLIRLWNLRRELADPEVLKDYMGWLSRKRLADYLERRLRKDCPDLDAVAGKLRNELRHPARSSSCAECLNSRLRVLQMVHRTVSDEMMATYALSWNLKPRKALGERCPYDALGVDIGQRGKRWYEVLLDAEEHAAAAA